MYVVIRADGRDSLMSAMTTMEPSSCVAYMQYEYDNIFAILRRIFPKIHHMNRSSFLHFGAALFESYRNACIFNEQNRYSL